MNLRCQRHYWAVECIYKRIPSGIRSNKTWYCVKPNHSQSNCSKETRKWGMAKMKRKRVEVMNKALTKRSTNWKYPEWRQVMLRFVVIWFWLAFWRPFFLLFHVLGKGLALGKRTSVSSKIDIVSLDPINTNQTLKGPLTCLFVQQFATAIDYLRFEIRSL